jgi:DNA-binding transcriptional LysR family regulator
VALCQVRLDLLDETRKLSFMIELRRLRALRELANRGTIAAAADALYLTPSAVSQQLAALEQQVGQPLLLPNGRTVRLTPAAEAVLAHADALFSELERMDATLAALAGGERGRVRIGAFSTAIRGLIVPAVGLLRDRAPAVELVVQDVESPEVFDLLARGELDLAISMESESAPRHDDERFARTPLMRDLLDVALPQDHRLAGEADVPLAALATEPFVAPPRGWSCEDVIRVGCAAAGFSPVVAHRSADWTAVMALVGAGLGVACVPRLAQDEPPPGVTIRPIAGDPPCRHLFIACRRGAEEHPALHSVVGAVQEVASRVVTAEASRVVTAEASRVVTAEAPQVIPAEAPAVADAA